MRRPLYCAGAIALTLALAACQPSIEEDNISVVDGKDGERTSGYSDTRNAYFGDTHIHTKNSFDAYIFNVRTTPDDAYMYGKGETIKHPSGYDITLAGPPLDFVAVTDHAAYMGILPALHDSNSPLSKLPIAKTLFGINPALISAAFNRIGDTIRSGKPIDEINDQSVISQTWADTVASAERHYAPGKFTTFSAYEYTSTYSQQNSDGGFAGGNLHRNVIFKGPAPNLPFSVHNSTNPEDLWDWMDQQRAEGREALSIPHNSNVSDSQMFKLETYGGGELSREYAQQRMRNEPLVEITQVKGTSETHPALSPNDEWANFEIYEYLLASQVQGDNKYSYVRKAVQDGMLLEETFGFNPFKFGFIGASDSHVSGAGYTENNYWSKVGIIDSTGATRGSVPPGGAKTWEGLQMSDNAKYWFSRWGASGLAGVWAEENTRESIYAAMRRKETYATSGTRIKVRFFASFDYADGLLRDPELLKKAYAKGVPMGGDLINKDGKVPTFIAWAMRDPNAAPLQRLQVVKLWVEDGKTQEKIIDISCSDGLKPLNGRCGDNGAEVDLTDCSISKDKGAPELRTMWRDPEYKTDQRAAYYIRVLENPTCRWSTWDAVEAGAELNPALQPTLQERAWTSPIWLAPAKG